MQFKGEFFQVPVSSIKVAREQRQRKELTGIEELQTSIKQHGLINPLVLNKDNELIAGERRYTAVKNLGWETVPVQYLETFDPAVQQVIELEENLKRKDLTWQEEALACAKIHRFFCDTNDNHTMQKTADYIGIHVSWLSKQLTLAERLESGDKRIMEASNQRAAHNIIERERERKMADECNDIADIIRSPSLQSVPQVKATAKTEDEAQVSVPEKQDEPNFSIMNANFEDWAKTYSGPRFNLIHCDFPYGVNHQKSAQGGAKNWGAYADSPDVYFHLLKVLAEHWDKFASPSAHLVFWFSMNYYTQTMQFFAEHMPQLEVNAFPLMWHKTDNKGILPDPQRGPRRTYETALFAASSDRKIIQAIANSYGAPTNKAEAIHISEKPEPMLRHFFRMIVDGYTNILDPTCGSGTAIRAAYSMGAASGLGIELNPEYAAVASKALRQCINNKRIADTVGF